MSTHTPNSRIPALTTKHRYSQPKITFIQFRFSDCGCIWLVDSDRCLAVDDSPSKDTLPIKSLKWLSLTNHHSIFYRIVNIIGEKRLSEPIGRSLDIKIPTLCVAYSSKSERFLFENNRNSANLLARSNIEQSSVLKIKIENSRRSNCLRSQSRQEISDYYFLWTFVLHVAYAYC